MKKEFHNCNVKCFDSHQQAKNWQDEFDRLWSLPQWGRHGSPEGFYYPPAEDGEEAYHDQEKIKSFIYTKKSEWEKASFERGVKAENKEWREGRRCEICGIEKSSNLLDVCNKCY